LYVYHYSEDPTITEFVPRQSRLGEALVWAIDAWHQPLYWLPRDCPRVCFWPSESTSVIDYQRWWGTITDRMVIAIEAGWLERVRSCQLYRYHFAASDFRSLDDNGMYVSSKTLHPLAVEPVGDLFVAMIGGGVELRLCRSLVPLGKAIIATTLDFSLIRMRNAQGWEKE
jgi:hypothetical protein